MACSFKLLGISNLQIKKKTESRVAAEIPKRFMRLDRDPAALKTGDTSPPPLPVGAGF